MQYVNAEYYEGIALYVGKLYKSASKLMFVKDNCKCILNLLYCFLVIIVRHFKVVACIFTSENGDDDDENNHGV